MSVNSAATIRTSPAPAWRGKTGEDAHAHRRGMTRTVCGQPAVEERFATPERPHCEACTAELALAGERIR